MKTIYRYKSLPANKAPNNFKYRAGKWYKHDGKLVICQEGFHCSKNIIDAMGFVSAGWLAKVEVRGDHLSESDKECWSEIKLVKLVKWTKKDSVSLAIYAAELCIDIYEKQYPDDSRPRDAIKAAKQVLRNDTAKNRSAAESAAESAWSAWSAAESAAGSAARSAAESARSARSAAESARSARSARSAAWSAAESARSARSAAESAAWKKILKQCHDFVLRRKGLQ